MRKQQALLVVAAAIAALLVWSASGRYTEVGAKQALPEGAPVGIDKAYVPDTGAELARDPLKGRSFLAQKRFETRPPLPTLPEPPTLPLAYVRLVPNPGPAPEAWDRNLRAQIVPPPEVAVDPAKPPKDEPPKEPADEKEEKIKLDTKVTVDMTKVARAVRSAGADGDPVNVYVPQGQTEWSVLEKWPNATFTLGMLDKNGVEMGRVENVDPKTLYALHLKKTLENEYHEERITRRVHDNDRDALKKFAEWCFEVLAKRTGIDAPKLPYGLRAVRLAIEELEKARAIQNDLELTKQLGSYYRAAYDLEGELRTYLAYMADGHGSDWTVLRLVGDAYDRVGATASAREVYAKAAATGEAQAKLALALDYEREREFDRAMEILKELKGGQAALAMARIRLVQGAFDEASGFAEQARKEGATAELSRVLGSLQYVRGKYAEADTLFSAGQGEDRRSDWMSDRAMAKVGAGNLDGAKAEFQKCLDEDPLNLLDPLFGIGDVLQRKNDVAGSNAAFETALHRAPDNPWILARLAAVRLRDGLADKATALAAHLLEVEPGCTDGLVLMGLAAAHPSLAKPDFDRAVAHLARAQEKEPENLAIIHEYARTLLRAGRTDKAIELLEHATNVTTGVGRSEGSLLALLAYAQFVGRRPVTEVQQTLQRGLRAKLDPTTKTWLDAMRQAVDRWERTRIWEDTFKRPPGDVGNGWEEKDQSLGIHIQLDGDHALFAGVAKESAPTRDAATRLDHEEDLSRLTKIEATFKACAGCETIFHLFLEPLVAAGGAGGNRRGGGVELGIGCDRNGFMVAWIVGVTNLKNLPPENLLKDAAGANIPWPMDDFHTVRFERSELDKDGQKGTFEIFLDDQKVVLDASAAKPVSSFDVSGLSKTGKSVKFGFLVDADAGAKVDVAVESVKVTKTTSSNK